ncbi:HpcH/HpaI aldolase family protein [Anaerobacterium chartisolvens]|nr:aldolase/citrate lyase family protein [Anaerobacterium chartisolvens]
MRPGRVLGKLRRGEVVSCFKVNLSDSRVVEIAAMMGFDCVWTDMEHVPNCISQVEKQVLAAKAYNTDVMVRVSRGSYSDYIRPLELDASGIMVPHIMSLQDARNVVEMTRFHPIGRRPVDGGNADAKYCNVGLCDYISQANRERFVAIQIEDPEPLEELEEIACLEGIDMLFFGPGDFSQGIGKPGQLDSPEVIAARRRVAAVAAAHGKFAGTVGSVANRCELISEGYRFISIGADVVGLAEYCGGVAKEFSGHAGCDVKSIYSDR